jgi:acyl-lipid omega-6 desaturase (Delta-12 desaturase)
MNKSYNLSDWLSAEIRTQLFQRSDLKALLFFTVQVLMYLICFLGAIADYSLIGNCIFTILTGLIIGQIFTIGHDAAHQSFAKSSFLNQFIARFAFLLTLHSYTLWVLEHNIKHHGNTNNKDKDVTWAPMTKEEFDRQSKIRQWLERFYRSPFGLGFYFIGEIWFKRHILPLNQDARSEWKKHLPDCFLIAAAGIIQPAIIISLGHSIAPSKSVIELLGLGLLMPLIIWSWVLSCIVYLQHTHPDIPWFQRSEKFQFSQLQIHVTAHVIFPKLIGSLLYNLMEHTAHHLQPSIPAYNLPVAQNQLEQVHSQSVIIYPWSFTEHLRIMQICKLYDFEQKCWTDFDGNPTSKVIHSHTRERLDSTEELLNLTLA